MSFKNIVLNFFALFITSTSGIAQSREEIDSYYKKGLDYKISAQYDSALFLYDKALVGYTKLELPALIAGAINRIGVVHFRLGDYDKAMQFQLRSFRINDSIGERYGIMKNMLNMGNIFNSTLDYHAAKKHYQEAIKIGQEVNKPGLMARTLNNMGSLYIDHPDNNPNINPDSALFYFRKAFIIFEEFKSESDIVGSLQNFGRVHEEKEQYDSALYFYKAALRKSDVTSIQATLYENLGNVHKKRGDTKLSLISYQTGLDLALESKVKNRVQTLSKNIAEVLIDSGHSTKAIPYLKQHMVYKDSVYNEEKIRQATMFKTIYQTERKEKELIAQKNQTREQETRAREATLAKNQSQVMLLVALLLVGIVLTLFVQRNRITQIAARNLALAHNQEIDRLLQQQDLKTFDALIAGQEKERKRLAEELHDRLGSVLSAAKMHLEGGYEGGLKQQQFDYINNLLSKAIDDTRQISHNMLSGVLTKFGLVAALHDLKETVSSADHLKVNFQTKGFDERLEGDKEVHLYRICQELLSNTLRHAEADHFRMQLEKDGSILTLKVTDNGKGGADPDNNGGIGFRNIASRVEKIGGQWQISSPAGQGTAATVTLKLS